MGSWRPGCKRVAGNMIAAAANDWWDHQELCKTCNQHDPVDPGAPRLVQHKNSIEILQVPDLTVLCEVGARLFRGWERAIPKAGFRIKPKKQELEEIEAEHGA